MYSLYIQQNPTHCINTLLRHKFLLFTLNLQACLKYLCNKEYASTNHSKKALSRNCFEYLKKKSNEAESLKYATQWSYSAGNKKFYEKQQ